MTELKRCRACCPPQNPCPLVSFPVDILEYIVSTLHPGHRLWFSQVATAFRSLKPRLFATKEAFCCSLARHGEVQLLDSFFKSAPDLSYLASVALTAGPQGGHLDVVKWACWNMEFLPHATLGNDWQPFELAASRPRSLHIFKWMGFKRRADSMAVWCGYIEYLLPSPGFFCYCGVRSNWFPAEHICTSGDGPLHLACVSTKEARKHAKTLHLYALGVLTSGQTHWRHGLSIGTIAKVAADYGHLYILKWVAANYQLSRYLQEKIGLRVRNSTKAGPHHARVLKWLDDLARQPCNPAVDASH